MVSGGRAEVADGEADRRSGEDRRVREKGGLCRVGGAGGGRIIGEGGAAERGAGGGGNNQLIDLCIDAICRKYFDDTTSKNGLLHRGARNDAT